MSNVVDEKKKTFTVGTFNVVLELNSKVFDCITIECKNPRLAMIRIMGQYLPTKSAHLGGKLSKMGWGDFIEHIENHQEKIVELEMPEGEVLMKALMSVEIENGDEPLVIRGTFFNRGGIM